MNQHFRRLFPLLLLIFIDSFSYFVVIPVLLLLFFNNDYGLLSANASQATRDILTGLTISLSPLAALIAAPFIGNLSDRYGRKKTLLICLTAICLGFLLPIIGIMKRSIILILLGRFVAGLGSVSQPVAQAAVADVCHDKEKAIFLSLIAVMMTLAIIVGPLAGSVLSNQHLVSWFNVTVPYIFAFIVSVLNLFLLWFFFHETIQGNMRSQMLSVKEVILGLKTAVKEYRIGSLLLVFFCLELGWGQYYQAISLYLSQQFHYTVQQVGFFGTYMGVLMALGLLFLYPLLIRRFSIEKIIRYSISLVLIGLVGCAIFSTATMQWLSVILVVVFTGTAYVSLLTKISNRVPVTHQGWIMGYASTILFLAWMLTAFTGGWLISIHSTLPIYLAAFALLIAVMTLIFG